MSQSVIQICHQYKVKVILLEMVVDKCEKQEMEKKNFTTASNVADLSLV